MPLQGVFDCRGIEPESYSQRYTIYPPASTYNTEESDHSRIIIALG